ncbi:MAG: hypothetical protein H0U03_14110 [Actinobacteria bacterium]|nr:hypothetical protein [Actinomycetota bacterium]
MLGRLGETRHHFGALPGVEARPAQLDLEPRVPPFDGQQLGRSLQEVEPGTEVLSQDRPAPGGPQPLAGAGGERSPALVVWGQLPPVAIGLPEVVTEQLVELDELGAVLSEPVGELLVQLRALRLRQALVGGVAHQEMAEAERVLSG